MSNQKQVSPSFAARFAMLNAHQYAPVGAAALGRDPSADILAVLGMSKKGDSSVFAFTAAVNDAIDKMGIDTTPIFAINRNPKVIKRFIQFVHAVIARDYKSIDKASATIIYALQFTDGSTLTTDALQYIAAGLKAGRIAPETKGVSRMTATRIFGGVKLGSIESQTSRSVGANGFLQLAGATQGEAGKVHRPVTINRAHPLIVAFNDCMNKANDRNIDEMMGESASA